MGAAAACSAAHPEELPPDPDPDPRFQVLTKGLQSWLTAQPLREPPDPDKSPCFSFLICKMGVTALPTAHNGGEWTHEITHYSELEPPCARYCRAHDVGHLI